MKFLAAVGSRSPSPAVVERIGLRSRESVRRFADANWIPVVGLAEGDRKIEVMGKDLARQAATGRFEGGRDRDGAAVPTGRDPYDQASP